MPFSPIQLDARNPGAMTGTGNHTYVIAGEGQALLVDAGVGDPVHLEALAGALAEERAELHGVLVTHAHGDHIAGAGAIASRHPSARFLKFPWDEEDGRYGVSWSPVRDQDVIRMAGHELVVLYTPGHSPDHVTLWHPLSRTAFTGDLVVAGSSVTIQASRGGDLSRYLASLERLSLLRPCRLLPAHGPAVDDPEPLLRGYIAHRLHREAQIVEALSQGYDRVPSIAGTIYHGLAPVLLRAAHENVRAHLEKLRREGRAVEDDDRWRLLPI